MARKNRLFIPGMPHLVQLRGHNDDALFRESEDYTSFGRCLIQAARRYEVAIHSWSLAPERILLLLSAPDKQALGRFIQHIGRSYVPYYNRRYQRHGSLWDNRYLSSPLEPGVYFLLVKKYIECGEDGVSGRHSFGEQPTDSITPHPVWQQLDADPSRCQERYQDFCRSPLNATLVARIRTALEQNCLLATPRVSQKLESRLERPLQARHSGRPRKHHYNPVEQWTWLEQQAEVFLRQHGYQQIRLSLLERQPLFAAGGPMLSGNGELRGDGTTGCLRLIAAHQHIPAMSRLWYAGVMFPKTAPSVGVQQNHQIGIEAFGMPGVDIELEHLVMQVNFFRLLGLSDRVELHINMLGEATAFESFRQALREHYGPLAHMLAPTQQKWLEQRPEWLLNHDDILLQRLALNAPRLNDFVSGQSQERFLALQRSLSALGVAWQHDRGLFPRNDYCQLVFEWRSQTLGNNLVLCRGGRYDACASRILERPVYACGFAFMVEPIMVLLSDTRHRDKTRREVDVVIIPEQPRVAAAALLLGRQLRQQFPHLSIVNDGSNFRSSTRLKNARRLGARFVVQMMGDGETLLIQDNQNQQYVESSAGQIFEHLAKNLLI
ncbi:histidine--tRNA ligase [Salmonella enterica subsp. enterica serovar Choleraesuis]|nr:histidine--tRNA ligase [Salmonella enterica subsp. enterica serovar Choleraesuis]